MRGRSHSRSDHSPFHRALIACVCAVMVLLSGGSPNRLASTEQLARQVDHRVSQIEAPNRTPVRMVRLDVRLAADALEELVELAELTDGDGSKDYVLRIDVAAFGSESQTGVYKPSADRALTLFLLPAFPNRGSPSA